ncbi:MAG: hypothetical protein EXR50_05410 [Dehalococcoidia bacterium]|nr:hypothetical protein [Dehalococcoidia bacterium]
MRCQRVDKMVDADDNLFRHCGSAFTSSLLPIPAKRTQMVRYGPALNSVLRKGAALELAGKALEVVGRRVLQQIVSSAPPRMRTGRAIDGRDSKNAAVNPIMTAETRSRKIVRPLCSGGK